MLWKPSHCEYPDEAGVTLVSFVQEAAKSDQYAFRILSVCHTCVLGELGRHEISQRYHKLWWMLRYEIPIPVIGPALPESLHLIQCQSKTQGN